MTDCCLIWLSSVSFHVHAANNIFFRKATIEKIAEHILIEKICMWVTLIWSTCAFLDTYLCGYSSGRQPSPEVEDGAGDPDPLRGGVGLDSAWDAFCYCWSLLGRGSPHSPAVRWIVNLLTRCRERSELQRTAGSIVGENSECSLPH
jgi:hypothetical protein